VKSKIISLFFAEFFSFFKHSSQNHVLVCAFFHLFFYHTLRFLHGFAYFSFKAQRLFATKSLLYGGTCIEIILNALLL